MSIRNKNNSKLHEEHKYATNITTNLHNHLVRGPSSKHESNKYQTDKCLMPFDTIAVIAQYYNLADLADLADLEYMHYRYVS